MVAIRSVRAKARSLPLSIKMVGVALVLFLALAPLIIAGYISQENIRQALLEEKRGELRTNAEAVINSIDRIIEVRLTEVVAMASNPSVVNYLASGAADPLAVETVVGEYRSYLSMRTDIKALSLIYAANGNVALSTSANQGQFLGNRPFFKSAVAGAPYASPPSRDGGAGFVYYSAPVKDSTGKVLAVLVMSVDAEDLWRELHK
ncbi:MAG: cache domain-containing protein, partial [Actinomycetota bacterium]